MPSLEWLLVAGIVAFYLQDATMLLHYDEFVVGGSGRGWQVRVGKTEWSGRYLCLPGPLAPHTAWFRGAFHDAPGGPAPMQAAALERFLSALFPFRVGTVCLGMILLGVAPILILRHAHPAMLLAALGATYLVLGGLVLQLWRTRAALGLPGRTVAWLAVECLACPPHGINLVRKLTLRHGPRGAAGAMLAHVVPADLNYVARVIARRRALFGAAR